MTGSQGQDTGEALAEVIHPHMKAVRDRGDYIVGPASDEAARAVLAAGYVSPADHARALTEAWDQGHRTCRCPCHQSWVCNGCRSPYRKGDEQ